MRSGTTCTTYGPDASAMRRADSSRIIGCSRFSSACFAAGSANTWSRIFFRSISPPGARKPVPKSFSMCARAAPPLSVSSRAMASVSTTVAPSAANSSAAADLPLPMPPVNPTTKLTGSSDALQVPSGDGLAPEHGDDAGDREIRPEVKTKAAVPASAREEHLQRAEQQSHQRGQQDDERQHLPAKKRADRGVHLEVAIAHALLAGGQLIALIHEPEREIAGGRAEHGFRKRSKRVAEIEKETEPDERQRQVVGQKPGFLIDEGKRDREPDEKRGAKRARRGPEAPRRISRAEAGKHLHHRIFEADPGPATGALAAQREPAQHRNVLPGADAAAALRAGRARRDETVGGLRR